MFTWNSYLSLSAEISASCSVSSRLFTKLVLEAPVITESALEVIRRYCEDEVRDIFISLFYRPNQHLMGNERFPECKMQPLVWAFQCTAGLVCDASRVLEAVSLIKASFQSRVYLGMTTLKELIVKRPSRQFQYLHVLLDLSSHEKEKVMGPH